MATRQIEFITGVETATQPAVQDPVNDEDLITLGFANRSYQQGKQSVADFTALRAIDSAICSNGDMIFVRGVEYEYWFDSASSAADDGQFYIEPDDSPANGRWRLNSILDKQIALTDTTQSTDKDTGAVVLEGGLGVEKNVNVGGILNVVGSATINNLTTTGSTTFVDAANLNVTDANITCNVGGDEAAADLADAGLTIEMSDADNAIMAFNSGLTSKWKCGDITTSSEVMTVGTDQSVTGLKRHTREVEYAPITTPVGNPASGLKFYAKSDDKLYTKNSAGVELPVVTGSGGGGGGGGGALNWYTPAGEAPIEDYYFDSRVFIYRFGEAERLTAVIKVPEGYTPGSPISMINYGYSIDNVNNWRMQTVATLIRKNVDAASTFTNTYTDNSGDLLNTSPNLVRSFTTDLTDGTGNINGVPVSTGDIIKVSFTRVPPAGTASALEVRFFPELTEVSIV